MDAWLIYRFEAGELRPCGRSCTPSAPAIRSVLTSRSNKVPVDDAVGYLERLPARVAAPA